MPDIRWSWIENLYHWPFMANKINNKRLSHISVEIILFEKNKNIKKISRMLAIQGSADFSGV